VKKSPGWYLSELKRRKVYRVAGVYALVAFGVWQVADIAFPGLGLPDSAVTLVLILTLLGFPIALVFAWAYELRPEDARPEETPLEEERPAEAGAAGVRPTAGHVAGDGASIAVLPFENLSAGPETEFFADGITEEITHTLAQSLGLRVVARTSAFAFKGQAADIREIAGKLSVSHVLEGSVRRAGDKLRITVQLIDAGAGFHIWSERYDREMGDVFAVQDEIADCVAHQLSAELPAAGAEAGPGGARTSSEVNVSAYDAYLRGKQVLASFDPRSIASGIRHFEESIELDPDFAPAHAALAGSYSAQAIGLGITSHDTMPRARAAADRALALDPGLADAHVARALVSMFHERDYQAAKERLDRALTLNPNSAQAYLWLEFHWTYIVPNFEAAVAATTRAQALSPLDPSIRVRLATVYFLFDEYDRAETYLREMLANEPAAPMVLVSLADTLTRTGRAAEGLVHAERALQILGETEAPGAPIGITGALRGLTGDRQGALALLATLETRASMGFVTSFWQAAIHGGLGDLDQAFECLDRAYEEGDCGLLYIYAAPAELGLRGDPRMPGMLDRLNLSHLLKSD
jgi:serine/threonine-protein kinase